MSTDAPQGQALANSLRSLIATLETVDADERQRADEEYRSAHVHTSALNEASRVLADYEDSVAAPPPAATGEVLLSSPLGVEHTLAGDERNPTTISVAAARGGVGEPSSGALRAARAIEADHQFGRMEPQRTWERALIIDQEMGAENAALTKALQAADDYARQLEADLTEARKLAGTMSELHAKGEADNDVLRIRVEVLRGTLTSIRELDMPINTPPRLYEIIDEALHSTRAKEGRTMNNEPILERIAEYLGNGGLFNPEMMDHDEVRNLVMAAREELLRLNDQVGHLANENLSYNDANERLRADNARLRAALDNMLNAGLLVCDHAESAKSACYGDDANRTQAIRSFRALNTWPKAALAGTPAPAVDAQEELKQ